MASEPRPKISPVIEQLFADPKRFDFFQAVRLLERQAQQADLAAGAAYQPVGHDAAPRQELARFRVRQTLEFPVSEIESMASRSREQGATQRVPGKEKEKENYSLLAAPISLLPAEMTVNFMGLTGPAGVLPRHYSQLILDRRDEAQALVDFLDCFNHRLISLFYRAWEKYHAGINFEKCRYAGSSRDDHARMAADIDLFSHALFSLVGLGTVGQRGRMAVDDDYFVYYSGCFAQRPANSLSLQGMLGEMLKAKVSVQQFFGQWLQLLPEEQTQMPQVSEVPTLRVQLGRGAVAGERVWDLQSKFRIRIGPIGYAFFTRMMPAGDRLLPLCQFVRTYVGPEFDFDVQLVLRGAEVPWCALDGNARLGWNTWVRVEAFQRDVDDVVFCLPQV
jgi:type VI secretion system protein ImpH